MNKSTEPAPTRVPPAATQVGEVRARWAWAAPSVWTDRMLTALEQGVKGGIWSIFSSLDGWIRMRLRSILRKRKGLRGRGRGADHQRWPNAYFAEHGLFSLKTARELASQPSCR